MCVCVYYTLRAHTRWMSFTRFFYGRYIRFLDRGSSTWERNSYFLSYFQSSYRHLSQYQSSIFIIRLLRRLY